MRARFKTDNPLMLMLTPEGIPVSEKSLRILLTRTREENQGKYVIFSVEKGNRFYMVNERFKTMNDMMVRVREYTRSDYHCYYTSGKRK